MFQKSAKRPSELKTLSEACELVELSTSGKPGRFSSKTMVITLNTLSNHYRRAIVSISDNMESRFEDLKQSLVFENMVLLLEVQNISKNINEFGDQEIIKIAKHFRDLLSKMAAI